MIEPEDMITQMVKINIEIAPEDAPNYDEKETTMLRIETAIIVRNGTKSGKSTVDLQMIDKHGKKYLVMATGAIIDSIGRVAVIDQ